MSDQSYTAFNQKGKFLDRDISLGAIMVRLIGSRVKYYFITNTKNIVIVNELKGKPLPTLSKRENTQCNPPKTRKD